MSYELDAEPRRPLRCLHSTAGVAVAGFQHLNVSIDGAVGTLELNRPASLNALSYATLTELTEAAAWFDGQETVKVVKVQGAGRAFSAGFDIADFVEPDPAIPMRDLADLGRVMAEAIADMRAITIAAIQGRCVGGGLVLAAACDLRLAATSCVFSIPEINLGIPLGWGAVPRLVREIGPALTKELVLTGREFTAHEAAAAGFLNRVIAEAELTAAVDELAQLIAAKPSLALTVTKNHVNTVAENVATTEHGHLDADAMVAALADPESRRVGQAYVSSFSKGGS
ncbi:MAG: enoyl-CoA hydratase/isomerase family protein [bacterium]|nr:enoyl-CoA hydratase/isomerase family protein [bacterium]